MVEKGALSERDIDRIGETCMSSLKCCLKTNTVYSRGVKKRILNELHTIKLDKFYTMLSPPQTKFSDIDASELCQMDARMISMYAEKRGVDATCLRKKRRYFQQLSYKKTSTKDQSLRHRTTREDAMNAAIRHFTESQRIHTLETSETAWDMLVKDI